MGGCWWKVVGGGLLIGGCWWGVVGGGKRRGFSGRVVVGKCLSLERLLGRCSGKK